MLNLAFFLHVIKDTLKAYFWQRNTLFYTTTLSRLFYLFYIYTCVLLMDVFKEINRLSNEINRLLSKGMPNIYLEVTIEKK